MLQIAYYYPNHSRDFSFFCEKNWWASFRKKKVKNFKIFGKEEDESLEKEGQL